MRLILVTSDDKELEWSYEKFIPAFSKSIKEIETATIDDGAKDIDCAYDYSTGFFKLTVAKVHRLKVNVNYSDLASALLAIELIQSGGIGSLSLAPTVGQMRFLLQSDLGKNFITKVYEQCDAGSKIFLLPLIINRSIVKRLDKLTLPHALVLSKYYKYSSDPFMIFNRKIKGTSCILHKEPIERFSIESLSFILDVVGLDEKNILIYSLFDAILPPSSPTATQASPVEPGDPIDAKKQPIVPSDAVAARNSPRLTAQSTKVSYYNRSDPQPLVTFGSLDDFLASKQGQPYKFKYFGEPYAPTKKISFTLPGDKPDQNQIRYKTPPMFDRNCLIYKDGRLISYVNNVHFHNLSTDQLIYEPQLMNTITIYKVSVKMAD